MNVRRFWYQQLNGLTASTSAPTVRAWPITLITRVRRSVGRSEEVRNGSTAPITGRGEATVEIRNT
jgi:hypothetical protein